MSVRQVLYSPVNQNQLTLGRMQCQRLLLPLGACQKHKAN